MLDAVFEPESSAVNLRLQSLNQRAGEYRVQPGDYKAFFPASLPPNPPIAFGPETWRLLSDADRALGRLDAVTQTLPDTELFLFMYVRKEALLSSQIEGTQASFEDIIQFEEDITEAENPDDIEEVVNYIRALNHGLSSLSELPISMRLVREVHAELMRGVRGQNRNPGEFRQIQNWIGAKNSDKSNALFIPPPPGQPLQEALSDLERFIHSDPDLPVLIQIALVHAQFETIHPFLDGNGRLGRLLITFLLCEKEVLAEPSLYISHFFKQHKSEYYSRLQAVRDRGDWEGWTNFFLRGVRDVAREGARTAGEILRLREHHRDLVSQKLTRAQSGSAIQLLDHMFRAPVVSINSVSNVINRSFANASTLVSRLCELDILEEITGRERDRLFRYSPYVALFRD